jgi:hypothetical protein
MLRPLHRFLAPTDRQRLLLGSVPQVSARSDRQLLTKPTLAQLRPKRPTAGAGTFAIYGKDGTFLSLDFGFGRLARRIDLYDYLPAGLVPHLSNLTFELTGVLPDAFGLDIGVGGGLELNNAFAVFPKLGGLGSAGLSGVGGINILWHSRGDLQAGWPEIHWYHGHSVTASKGSVVTAISELLSPVSLSGAAQLILAWAHRYNEKGVPHPSASKWVANGYNWTGTFWSEGFSIPVYGKYSLVCSRYQSVESLDNQKEVDIWRGVSIGVGISGKGTMKTGLKWDDITRIKLNDLSNLKSLGINQSVTHYGLWYGNGGDYLPDANNNNKPKRSLEGFNWPTINQDEDK